MTQSLLNINPHYKVNFPLCLAPMVGLSHVALRQVLRQYLPTGAQTIWPTEMLNSRRLPKEDFATTPEIMRQEFEDGLVPQILGNEEKFIEPSVKKLIDWGAVGIDINMGCPVAKALRHNYGVALMGDRDYAAQVVSITKKHSSVPVSVKLRAGIDGDINQLESFVKALVDAGADWICLHPRTAGQMRRGKADWSQIARLKKQLAIPVIGNGDIQTSQDVFSMLSETGVDMVMSGRALAARPWMLWQVGEDLGFSAPSGFAGKKAPRTQLEEGQEYGEALKQLWQWSVHYFGLNLAIRKFRFHVRTTHVWLLFGHELMSRVNSAQDDMQMRTCLEKFFSQETPMLARTELRQ